MNVFSLLLSGASFATSLLSPTQWLVPLPECFPMFLQEQNIWQQKKLEGFVYNNSITFTPLSSGEVNLVWKLNCPVKSYFAVEWSIPPQSYVQGIFKQESWHTQYLSNETPTVYLEGSGEGTIKLFLPDTSTPISFTVRRIIPEGALTRLEVWSLSHWRVFDALLAPTFQEVRTASTSYFPSFADTLPITCHTKGDLLVKRDSQQCFLARGEIFATNESRSLYTVKSNAIQTLSSGEVSTRPNTINQVIITEVMWAGSYFLGTSFQTDQWIELHNSTSQRLNLQGSRLRGAKSIGDVVFQSDLIIPPKGFIIIGRERGSKTSLKRDPDKVELLGLPFSGKSIQLFSREGTLLDETPLPPWPAGRDNIVSKVRSSMQRKWMDSDGKDPNNWGECSPENESFRCSEISKDTWRSEPGENLGTPWNFNVL